MEVTYPDPSDDPAADLDLENVNASFRFPRRQSTKSKKVCAKEERNASIKRVSLILQKSEDQRTFEEAQMLRQCSEAVEEVQLRWKKRDEAKRRLEEFEEPGNVLRDKCQILAQAIAQSQHLVVYTGAGISTAARIPDYRGPNGIWTRLQQGKEIGNHDLSLAEPTFTHMALSQLYHRNILKYVVSQNCDGLHLRSGLPRHALSELHGNMYVEVCKSCKPVKEYWRLFDVTENTARFSHKTMRRCYACNEPLVDTIVHFGERGTLQWPLNWSGASKNAQKATTILCLGSSLKVLKRYPWLWQMDKPAKRRPNLYIVNLQWTPKDECANVKIHGQCDVVMKLVMDFLGVSVPAYDRKTDPIFYHASQLCEEEVHTTTQPVLKCSTTPDGCEKEEWKDSEVNSSSFPVERTGGSTVHSAEPPSLQSASSDCDITRNTRSIKDNVSGNATYSHFYKPCEEPSPPLLPLLPQRPQDTKKRDFSIDSILHNDTTRNSVENVKPEHGFGINANFFGNNILLPQNYRAFVAYYRLTNAVMLQSPLLGYQDAMYYPYQTSLLYSGLHNIINSPPPPISNGYNYMGFNQPQTKSTFDDNKIIERQTTASMIGPDIFSCKFCNRQFKSVSCLFYGKNDTVFLKPEQCVETDKKPIVCLCCEYSSDEEDDECGKKENASELCPGDGSVVKVNDERDNGQIKAKIQAGWFGKGYRKIKRPRKK